MSVVEFVLKEEVERLKSSVQFFKRKLDELPRGTIFIYKKIYVYRKKKVDGKVISQYIGKEGSEAANKAKEDAIEYKRMKHNLRIAKSELYKLRRVSRIYD